MIKNESPREHKNINKQGHKRFKARVKNKPFRLMISITLILGEILFRQRAHTLFRFLMSFSARACLLCNIFQRAATLAYKYPANRKSDEKSWKRERKPGLQFKDKLFYIHSSSLFNKAHNTLDAEPTLFLSRQLVLFPLWAQKSKLHCWPGALLLFDRSTRQW